jgi:uncharacterized LabA/DUF88 family protein
MVSEKSVRFFVDSQNFLRCFWPENSSTQFALREVNWGLLTKAIVEKIGATSYNTVNFYEAFPGGELPKDPSTYRPGFAQLVGKELQSNPKFLIRPGSLKMNNYGRLSEKGIDTTIVVDMTRGAILGEYDVAVLFSGDLDMKPGVIEALRSGRECVICGWNQRGLSYELKKLIQQGNGLTYLDLTTLGTAFITRVISLKKNRELSSGEFAVYLLLADYHYQGINWVPAQDVVSSTFRGMPPGPMNRYSFLRNLATNNLIETDFFQMGPQANVRLVA